MAEQTLKFSNIRINKKEFHKSKQPIDLMSVNIDQIIVLTSLNIVKKIISIILVIKKMRLLNPLCIILPQMSG